MTSLLDCWRLHGILLVVGLPEYLAVENDERLLHGFLLVVGLPEYLAVENDERLLEGSQEDDEEEGVDQSVEETHVLHHVRGRLHPSSRLFGAVNGEPPQEVVHRVVLEEVRGEREEEPGQPQHYER